MRKVQQHQNAHDIVGNGNPHGRAKAAANIEQSCANAQESIKENLGGEPTQEIG